MQIACVQNKYAVGRLNAELQQHTYCLLFSLPIVWSNQLKLKSCSECG